MVRKEQCPRCKGNKYVCVTTNEGRQKNTPCPSCSGAGYTVRVTLPSR